MMHLPSRGREKFKQFIVERLAEAVEEEILPSTEEGIEVGIVVLTILHNEIKRCRNFDQGARKPTARTGRMAVP